MFENISLLFRRCLDFELWTNVAVTIVRFHFLFFNLSDNRFINYYIHVCSALDRIRLRKNRQRQVCPAFRGHDQHEFIKQHEQRQQCRRWRAHQLDLASGLQFVAAFKSKFECIQKRSKRVGHGKCFTFATTFGGKSDRVGPQRCVKRFELAERIARVRFVGHLCRSTRYVQSTSARPHQTAVLVFFTDFHGDRKFAVQSTSGQGHLRLDSGQLSVLSDGSGRMEEHGTAQLVVEQMLSKSRKNECSQKIG